MVRAPRTAVACGFADQMVWFAKPQATLMPRSQTTILTIPGQILRLRTSTRSLRMTLRYRPLDPPLGVIGPLLPPAPLVVSPPLASRAPAPAVPLPAAPVPPVWFAFGPVGTPPL